MSQPDFYAILDECLSCLKQGEPPEACLAEYPAQAAELAPDLALTAELLQLSRLEPSADAVSDGYQKMMAALESQKTVSPLASLAAFIGKLVTSLGRQQRGLAAVALRTTVIAVVVLVVAGTLVVTAAADTLPGDALYPVKRSWESARLTLTVDDSSRQELQSKFERRRREEVQAVLDLRRPVVVEFKGTIESIVSDEWQVDGLDLAITDETQVIGLVAVGQRVTVRARVKDDGSLLALKIVVNDSLPSDMSTPIFTPPPTQTPRPTRNAAATQPVTTPTPSPEETRPEPTATGKPTDRPTREPTATLAPSVGGGLTREPEPTTTRPTDSLATSAVRPTRTPANTDPTPTKRPADTAPTATATPMATATLKRDLEPTRAPTATRNTDAWKGTDRPP